MLMLLGWINWDGIGYKDGKKIEDHQILKGFQRKTIQGQKKVICRVSKETGFSRKNAKGT